MTSATARAAVWHGTGDRFAVTELPLPAPGPGEVLVATRLATLCGSDLHTIAGERETPLPTVLGHEMVGEVVAAGDGAALHDGTPVTAGRRVTWTIGASCGHCPRCRRGIPQKCRELRKYGHAAITDGWALNGGLASHCHLLPGTELVPVPDRVPDAAAAPANCATATVACAVRRVGAGPGDTVVVQGCGMLGLTAVAYLRARGAGTVIACDVDAERRELAIRGGADTAVAPEDLAGAVRDGTGGEGADVVLDLSGSDAAIAAALDLPAIGGRIGLVGSVFPTPGVTVRPERLVRGLITVTGVHNYAPSDLADAVAFLERDADLGLFAGFVPEVFPLEELDDAVAHAVHRRPPRVGVDPRP